MYVSPWRRRILVSSFQHRLLAGNLLYLASVVLAFGVVLFGPVVSILLDDSVPPLQREVAARQLLTMQERVWFAIPVLIALCILHAAVVSHRIAGPLYRFKQIFADLAQGDLTVRIDLRRHDYLREEAEIMAGMVTGLRERVEGIQHGYRQASATLPQLMEAVGRGANADAAVLAGKLGTQMDALGQRVREFQVTRATPPVTREAPIEPTHEETPVG